MKKLYTLLLISVLFSGAFKAQTFTLTQSAYEPVVGDFERRKGFDSTSVLNNSAGSNQTWNFTSLTSNTAAVVVNTYTTPSTIPGYTAFTSFSGATVGKTDGTVGEFYKSNGTTYEMLGMAPSSSLALSFTNTAIVAQWPVTSTYSVSDVISGSIKVNLIIPTTGPFNGTQNVSSIGTGTLQLPNGITLNNCMLMKSAMTGTGSVTILTITANATLTSTGYNYYHSSQKFPVLSIVYSTTSIKTGTAAPNVTNNVNITVNNDVFAGITEINEADIASFYPNPASNNLFINLNKINSATVEIYNELGQIVLSEKLFQHNNTVDISMLKSGIYFVRTTGDNKYSVRKLIKE